MGEWISCKDQIADEGKMVLVQTKDCKMFVAKREYSSWREKDEWYSYGTGGRRMKVMSRVVAWMPLPSPYNEEGVTNE